MPGGYRSYIPHSAGGGFRFHTQKTHKMFTPNVSVTAHHGFGHLLRSHRKACRQAPRRRRVEHPWLADGPRREPNRRQLRLTRQGSQHAGKYREIVVRARATTGQDAASCVAREGGHANENVGESNAPSLKTRPQKPNLRGLCCRTCQPVGSKRFRSRRK